MGTKKLPEDIAIKRRSVLVLLTSLGLIIKSVMDFLSFDIDRWIIGGIIFFIGLVLFIFQYMQKRYFYCPKCKSKCNWKITEKRIDDLTPKRNDGQRDRRYGLRYLKYYYYRYNCSNKKCGYEFGEWQAQANGPTWKETQEIENKKWYDA